MLGQTGERWNWNSITDGICCQLLCSSPAGWTWILIPSLAYKQLLKQLLNSVFCDVQNYQGLGKRYQPQPSALADNNYLALDNSKYNEKPRPIIVENMLPVKLPLYRYHEEHENYPEEKFELMWPSFRWNIQDYNFTSRTRGQTPRRALLKILRAAEYFLRNWWCLVSPCNAVSSIWYILSLETKSTE